MAQESKPTTYVEYRNTVSRWTGTYQQVVAREREAWIRDWLRGLQTVPYLKITKTVSATNPSCLVQQVGMMNYPLSNYAVLRDDLARVWNQCLLSDVSIHAFDETPRTITFYFAARTPSDTMLTGRLSVEKSK